MAAAKRYSVEQVVAKLREHETLQGQGLTIPQACKRIGISDQTFYRWVRFPSIPANFSADHSQHDSHSSACQRTPRTSWTVDVAV